VELEAFDAPKTQRLVKALSGWDAEGRVLLLTRVSDENLYKSGRNVARLTIKKFGDASALDVLRHDVIAVEDGAWESRPAPGGGSDG
jgi:ribosomal protein L4